MVWSERGRDNQLGVVVQIGSGEVGEACGQVRHHNTHLKGVIHDVSKGHAPFSVPHLNHGKMRGRVVVISGASDRKFECIRAFGPREEYVLEAVRGILNHAHHDDVCSFSCSASLLQIDISYGLDGKCVNCFQAVCLAEHGG